MVFVHKTCSTQTTQLYIRLFLGDKYDCVDCFRILWLLNNCKSIKSLQTIKVIEHNSMKITELMQ